MKLTQTFAALAVAATAGSAAGVRSGLQPGERGAPFDVVAVTGPQKGSQLCYF